MMPPFANDGIFAIDSVIQRYYQLLSGPAVPTYSSHLSSDLGAASSGRAASHPQAVAPPSSQIPILLQTAVGTAVGSGAQFPVDLLFGGRAELSSDSAASAVGAVPAAWLWQDDLKDWVPYDPQSTAAIEEAYLHGEQETSISVNGREYRIDLVEMWQESDNGYQRFIQRRPLASAPPPALSLVDDSVDSSADSTLQSDASRSPAAPLLTDLGASNDSSVAIASASALTPPASNLQPMEVDLTLDSEASVPPPVALQSGSTSSSTQPVCESRATGSGDVFSLTSFSDPRTCYFLSNKDFARSSVHLLFPLALQVYNSCVCSLLLLLKRFAVNMFIILF